MKKTHCLLIAALATTSFIGVAQGADNPRGPYIGIGAGQFNLNIDDLDDIDDAAATVRDSDDNAWKLFAGYRIMRWLSAEIAFLDLGNPGDSFDASGSDGNYQVAVSGFAPSVIGTLPLGPIEIFGKVGRYYYDVDTQIDFDSPGPDLSTSYSRDDSLWGAGISGVIFEKVELRVEYQKIEIDNADDSDAVWLSAAWRF